MSRAFWALLLPGAAMGAVTGTLRLGWWFFPACFIASLLVTTACRSFQVRRDEWVVREIRRNQARRRAA